MIINDIQLLIIIMVFISGISIFSKLLCELNICNCLQTKYLKVEKTFNL